MPTFEITSPDGARFEITAPEGATQEQVLNYARQNAPAPAPPPRPSLATTGQALTGATGTAPETWSDIALGAGRGVAKEAASFLPLPMNPMQPPPAQPPTMEGVVSPYLGTSEGPSAQMAERAGRYASGAILPGGMVRRGLSVALPAAGAEAGRAVGGPYGELAGAVTGGLASGLGAGRQMANKALASQLLKGEAKAGYKTWDDLASDTIVSQPAFKAVVDDITKDMQKLKLDKGLHPSSTALFERLQTETSPAPTAFKMQGLTSAGTVPTGSPVHISLEGIETLRKNATGIASRATLPADQNAARVMAGKLNDFMDDVVNNPSGRLVFRSGDPIAGVAALKEAKADWQAMRRTEAIEGLIHRAQNRSPQFSQSGMENALRTEFRQLAQTFQPKNPSPGEIARAQRARNMWTAEQRAAIERIDRGGTLGNVMRGIGRFAPKGPVSAGMLAAISSLIPGIGPAVAGAVAGGAAVGHRAALSATQRNVDRVYELVSRGQQRRPDKVRGQALARALLAGDQNRP